MTKFVIGVLVFAGTAFAQFPGIPGLPTIVFDPANKGINAANLAQMEQLLQTMMEYRQFYETAQGMFHCPSCFMSSVAGATDAVISIMDQGGQIDLSNPDTARKVASLKKIMTLGQTAIQEAQIAKAMSTGNGASVAMLTIQMAQVAQQTNDQMRHLLEENQIKFYTQHNGYVPMAKTINSWRLK